MSSRELEIRQDFDEFIDYIQDCYSSVDENVDVGNLPNLMRIYYLYSEIENFNFNEIYQFTKTLVNYKGEPIATKDHIKYVSLAIDFARSNNPTKKQKYWCEFSQKYILTDEKTEVHTIAKLAITCISEDYLKSIDLYEEEAYKYYLSDKCSHALNNLDYGMGTDIEEEVLKYKLT